MPQLAESLGAKAAGLDLGDDGTLTRCEKLMIFSRFYKKHLPGDRRRGCVAGIESLVKRYRGAKFIALCGNMKLKYGESPLEMWETLMGGAEERKRDLDHELAVIKAEEAHQIALQETTDEHQTLLKLAQSFLSHQEASDAGRAESGRLQNLRFHLQPWCAIWTVEGVPADPDGRSRDPVTAVSLTVPRLWECLFRNLTNVCHPGIYRLRKNLQIFCGRSYRVKGHESTTNPTRVQATGTMHDPVRDGVGAHSTTAHSNVFSGMESADGLATHSRDHRRHTSDEQLMKADHHGHGEQGFHGYDGSFDRPKSDGNRHRDHHDNHHWQHNAEYKVHYYEEHRQKYSQSGHAALGFDLWGHG